MNSNRFNHKLTCRLHWIFSFFLLGYFCESNAQVNSIFRTEPNHNRYNSSQFDAVFSGGYFYLSGSSDDNYENEPSIIKTDSSGNLIWTTTYINAPFRVPAGSTQNEFSLSDLFLLSDGLYALNRKELWKVDSLTGIIRWKLPINVTQYGVEYVRDWDSENFLLFGGDKFEIRNRITSDLVTTLSDPDVMNGFLNYCLDDERNFYMIHDEYISKYDSTFSHLWTSFTDDDDISDIFFHKGTGKLILTVYGWPRFYTADAVSGTISPHQKLYTIPRGSLTVNQVDLSESNAVYLGWGLTDYQQLENNDFGCLVTKLNPATGEILFNKEVKVNGGPFSISGMKILGDTIYLAGRSNKLDGTRYNISIGKLNKLTGDSIYCKEIFNDSIAVHIDMQGFLLIGQRMFIPLNWKYEYPMDWREFSSILVVNESGDSIRLDTFPGRLQYLTRTENLFYLDENRILAVSQLSTALDISVLDYNFNTIRNFQIPQMKAMSLSFTKDRFSFVGKSILPSEPELEFSLGGNPFFYVYTYEGELMLEEEFEIYEDLSVTTLQGVIHLIQYNNPYSVWQVRDDHLLEVISDGNNDRAFLNWRDSTSIFLERYNMIQGKGTLVNYYDVSAKSFLRTDTIFDANLINSVAIRDDQLYMAAFITHPSSVFGFFRYDLIEERKIWDHIDRSYARLYAAEDILFGIYDSLNGSVIHGINQATGNIVWQTYLNFEYYKIKISLDTILNQLLVYDYSLVESGVPYIGLHTISSDGVIQEIIKYTGAKPINNHLYSVLPFTYHQQPFYLTGGAFYHPILRKTAFINLYKGDTFKKPVKIEVFYDKNQNKFRDSDEHDVFVGKFLINATEVIFNTGAGPNHLYMYSPNNTIEYEPIADWTLTTDSIQNADSGDTATIKFGVFNHQEITRVIPSITAFGRMRCNSIAKMNARVLNESNHIVSGVAKLVFTRADFIDSSLPVTEINLDTLIYEFSDLQPGQELSTDIRFRLDGPPFLGWSHYYWNIEYHGEEPSDIHNTEVEFGDIIRCSYDPNDKLVNPSREPGNLTLIEEAVYYTIRFQNTGNDTAFRVEIIDTLSNHFDRTSFKFLSSSHPCEISLDKGIMKALFSNILLPDSTADFENSQGYIHFSILAKKEIDNQTIITNRAVIYFDFNPGVLTNITASTFVEEFPVHTNELTFLPALIVYPNPSSHSIHVLTDKISSSLPLDISFMDISGRTCLRTKTRSGDKIDLNSLHPGIYFMVMRGFRTVKVVVN